MCNWNSFSPLRRDLDGGDLQLRVSNLQLRDTDVSEDSNKQTFGYNP